jgi:hypothetical protein
MTGPAAMMLRGRLLVFGCYLSDAYDIILELGPPGRRSGVLRAERLVCRK